MKKILSLLLATTLAPLALIACSPATKDAPTSENPPTKETPNTPKESTSPSQESSVPKKAEFTTLTGGKTGNYYKAATEMNEILGEIGFGLKIEESPGSIENIQKIGTGKIDIAFAQNDATALQRNVDKKEKTKIFDNLVVLAPISDEVVHIVVNKKAGIKKLADLKGKKVAFGPKNSGTFVSAAVLYYANNIDESGGIYQDVAESIEKVKKGELDAAFFTTAVGVPLLKDISADDGKDLELLPIEDFSFIKTGKLDRIYLKESIPANSYPWQTKEVKALATTSYILVKKDLDEDKVYEIAKAIYPKAKDLKSKNPFWKKFSIDEAKADLKNGTPYHPGVVKFFKEK